MQAIVAERGQVTIPKAVRDRLGITPKTVLEFRADRGMLVAVKVVRRDPVDAVRGCLKLTRPTEVLIAEMRGDG